MKSKLIAGSSLLALGLALIFYGFLGSGVSADTILSEQGYLAFGISIVVGILMILGSIILFTLAAFSSRKGS